MLLVRIDGLNWSDVFGHVRSGDSFEICIVDEIAVVSSVAARGRVVVNTRDCFLLEIFMDFVLSQKASFVCRLVVSCDKGPFGYQGLSFSIV
jgi:hypothetical protein